MENNDGFLYWLVGFADGEGCFYATVSKKGYLSCSFILNLSNYDKDLLLRIRDILGVGRVSKDTVSVRASSNRIQVSNSYYVSRTADLRDVIIPLFDKYPLLSKKRAEYILWKELILVYRSKAYMRKPDKSMDEINFLVDAIRDLKGTKEGRPLSPSNAEAILKKVRWMRSERERKRGRLIELDSEKDIALITYQLSAT